MRSESFVLRPTRRMILPNGTHQSLNDEKYHDDWIISKGKKAGN
jgi:hypothetical protein